MNYKKEVNEMITEYASQRMMLLFQNLYTGVSQRIFDAVEGLTMPEEVGIRAIQVLKSNLRTISMTTQDVAAGACITVAVLSLQIREHYPIMHIARFLGISSSAIRARIFKLLASRDFNLGYRMNDVALMMPSIYPALVGKSGICIQKEVNDAVPAENAQE